ncbi:PilZ domain-containing protein [Stutzerimonas nitrititolerans]|uniref:PilZ domain-containing protein n=1 Tax=Stutzerimonas nitrititolerans TaxID=2482751 RepID=UPI00289B3D9E|nr:PilZ domain-containing protein [Stutzerimonas nitrititolerans]
MTEETVLTRDELAYINRLVNRAGPDTGAPRTGFRIDGGPQPNELLVRLASQTELSLQAKFPDFTMSFPLQLKEDEFHNLDLQLAPPLIYEEHGSVTRAWRLQLEEPLALLTSDGSESSLSVQELSSHGLLVNAGKHRKPPKHFHLCLALPDDPPLEIEASRVREMKGGLAAYEVEFAKEQDAERIRAFLYQQHQRLHPELQPELPVDLV